MQTYSIFEAEVKRLKRDKSDQNKVNQNLVSDIKNVENECQGMYVYKS